ncbi:MAG: ArsR/SmtB family transcription factor [Candidatus Binatia bacterium]
MKAKRQSEPFAAAGVGRFLTALGDPTRQRIVALLSSERLNVGRLAERVELSQPAVSHHLKILVDAGVLREERKGRERVYRLDPGCCQGLVEELRSFVSNCCAKARCC